MNSLDWAAHADALAPDVSLRDVVGMVDAAGNTVDPAAFVATFARSGVLEGARVRERIPIDVVTAVVREVAGTPFGCGAEGLFTALRHLASGGGGYRRCYRLALLLVEVGDPPRLVAVEEAPLVPIVVLLRALARVKEIVQERRFDFADTVGRVN